MVDRCELGERLGSRSLSILLITVVRLLLLQQSVLRLPRELLPLLTLGERRRIGRLVEPERPEVVDGESPTRRVLELAQSLAQGHVGNLDDLDDLGDAAAEVVHPRGEEEARSTDSGGSSTDVHPVSGHSSDEASGVLCDLLRLVTELEEGGEAGDVEGRVDGRELESESFDELEVGRSEDEDVDLGCMLSAPVNRVDEWGMLTSSKSEKSMSMCEVLAIRQAL